ncbi:Flp family type IVb pilin [Altericroceibacterium endophyticum]|nr:Flp family type IVb pilin [Altericroceibacterium endophyticum]
MSQIKDNEAGATAVEYGLILALIAMVILAALGGMADQLTSLWTFVETQVQSAI